MHPVDQVSPDDRVEYHPRRFDGARIVCILLDILEVVVLDRIISIQCILLVGPVSYINSIPAAGFGDIVVGNGG